MANFMTSLVLCSISLCLLPVYATRTDKRLNEAHLYDRMTDVTVGHKPLFVRRPLHLAYYKRFADQSAGTTNNNNNRDESVISQKRGFDDIEYGVINRINKGSHNYDDMTLSEEACDVGSEISCTKGTVTSLGYPDPYPPNITCRWLIKATKGQVVHLNFRDISLADGDCVRLSYRGSAVQHLYDPAVVLCGDLRPQKFTSVGHEVEVIFEGDGSGQGRGMLFDYHSRSPVPCEDLIELEGISGKISSPGYPHRYLAHINCTWRIITPEDTKVRVSFRDFAIEYARSCDYDVLAFYDGATTSQTKLAAYCGHELPDDVVASTNVILAVLTSDISSEDRGFSLQWTAN